jgi:serine/threonine protein kinase
VVAVLGEGSFGRVYRACDEQLRREVAIKVPHPQRVGSPEDLETYLAEARIRASLHHPGIVPVYDCGSTPDGLCYVVSQIIDGSDLATEMKNRRFSFPETAELIATARGEGHRVDGRSDVFSLGVVFYEMLTGRVPFQSDSLGELLELITSLDPRPPRQLDVCVPTELERICLKALARRATERYLTAKDLADDLRHFLRGGAESQLPAPGLAVSDESPALPA